jgi:hypothetical protein
MRAFSKLKSRSSMTSPRGSESKRFSVASARGKSQRGSVAMTDVLYTTDELQEMEAFPGFPSIKESRGDDKKTNIINKIRLCAVSFILDWYFFCGAATRMRALRHTSQSELTANRFRTEADTSECVVQVRHRRRS